MYPVPKALEGTPWEFWLRAVPELQNFDTIDKFRKAFGIWLNDAPGHNAVLSETEALALATWLTRLELDLVDAKIGEIDTQQEPLVYAFITLIGAVVGASFAATLGLTAAGIAASALAIGLAAIGVLFAGVVVLKNTRKARQNRILSQLRQQSRALVRRFWP